MFTHTRVKLICCKKVQVAQIVPPNFLTDNVMSSNVEKRKYGKWTAEDMERALQEYADSKLGLNECCRKYEIPKPTFLRHFRGIVKRGSERSTGKRSTVGVNGE